jgi:hypothetical protein
MGHDMKKQYRRWISELWNGNLNLADELVSADFTIHQARSGGERSEDEAGPEAIRSLVKRSRGAFSEIHFSIVVGPIEEDGLVAGRWSAEATYAGGMPGATAKPGTKVTFGGTDILRHANGVFQEYWVSSDGLSLMEQLGAFGG